MLKTSSVRFLLPLLLLVLYSGGNLRAQQKETGAGNQADTGEGADLFLPTTTYHPPIPVRSVAGPGERDIDRYEKYVWVSPVLRRGDTNRQDFTVPLRLSDGTEVRGLGQIFNPFFLYDFYRDIYTEGSNILAVDSGTDADYIEAYNQPIFYTVDSLFILPYKYILSDPQHSAYVDVFRTSYDFNSEGYRTKGFVEERGKLELLSELELTPEMLDRTVGASTQADSFRIEETKLAFDPALELEPKQSMLILYTNDDAPAIPGSSLTDVSEAQQVVGYTEYGRGEPEYYGNPIDTFRCFGVVMERKNGVDTIRSLWKKRIPLANGKIISSNGTVMITVYGEAGYASGLREHFGEDVAEEGIRSLYPLPASTTTRIEFSLQEPSQIQLQLFGADGREVRTLEKGAFGRGNYSMEIDVSDLPEGSYIAQLKANRRVFTSRLLLRR